MAKYIILGNFTDQGIRTVKETTKRVEALQAMGAKLGVKLHMYWTMGAYDWVAIADAPSDEAYMEFVFHAGSGGNARTTTLKAWTKEDVDKVVAKL